jgi:phosphoglycerate dehydrogenase-like enzyme
MARAVRVLAHVQPGFMQADTITPERIRAALGDIAGVTLEVSLSDAALEAALPGAEVLLLCGVASLHDLARRAPHLRWLSVSSAGVEWVLKAGLPEGVALTNASGTHEPKAGEYALTAVLMLNLFMPHFMAAQRERRWSPRSGPTLAGKTALILGMGALGGASAVALKQRDMRVIGASRGGRAHPAADVAVAGEAFRDYLPEADFLLITLPSTPATRGLIGARELDLLPAHAGVVNMGRGDLLDHEALLARLEAGTLGGAVLDALPVEPLPADSPIWSARNLIVTPHCGLYDPRDYGLRALDLFAANLRRWQAGEPLRQVVDPARGY